MGGTGLEPVTPSFSNGKAGHGWLGHATMRVCALHHGVRALEEPLRQLADNAGLEASVVVNKVRTAAKGQGLNVDTNEVEDLVKAGIIDPTMVTRSALQNAASIAKNILMTEAIVAEPPEKAGAGMAGGMGGMGGMEGMM
jgi:chaperonin GroEL